MGYNSLFLLARFQTYNNNNMNLILQSDDKFPFNEKMCGAFAEDKAENQYYLKKLIR